MTNSVDLHVTGQLVGARGFPVSASSSGGSCQHLQAHARLSTPRGGPQKPEKGEGGVDGADGHGTDGAWLLVEGPRQLRTHAALAAESAFHSSSLSSYGGLLVGGDDAGTIEWHIRTFLAFLPFFMFFIFLSDFFLSICG